MKPITLALAIFPLFALGLPSEEESLSPPQSVPKLVSLEKRAVTCALGGSNVRYHTSASAGSPAPGQFGATGTKVSFSCYKIGGNVNGNKYWDKVASGKGKGYYVSDYYVNEPCPYNLPPC